MISATHAIDSAPRIAPMCAVAGIRDGNARTGVDPIAIDDVGVTWVRRTPTSFGKSGYARPEQG